MNETGTLPAGNFTRQALSSTFWAYVSLLAGKAISLVSSIVLARLLFPEQFGLVSICLIVLSYLEILVSGGTESALIARRAQLRETANAAFILNLALGFVLLGVTWLLAPQIAAFFDAPAVAPLLRTLSLALPLMALGIVPDALLQKNLRFRARVLPDFAGSLAKAVLSIVLALSGWGAISLILGQIAGEAAFTLCAWLLAHWRPTRHFSRQAAKTMLAFGVQIVMIGFLGVVLGNLDYMIVGRVLGAAALGFYTLAFRIPELLIGQITWAIGRTAFPVMVAHNASDGYDRIYYKYLRYICLLSFPLGVGLAMLAAPLMLLLYTARWQDSIVPMALIACAMTITSVGYIAGVLYKATNRPGVLNLIMLARLPLAFVLLLVGTRLDISGVALAQCILALIFVLVDGVVSSRLFHLSPRAIAGAIQPAGLSALALALVVGGLQLIFPVSGLLGLVLLALAGAAVYVLTLALISRETVNETRAALMAFLRPVPPHAPAEIP